MVRVNYIKDGSVICISLSGHAGYANVGEDIVCSACSILAYTLAQSLIAMAEDGNLEGEPAIRLDPGDILIRCVPKDDAFDSVEAVFTFALIGYRLLEHKYPQNVRLKLFGTE